MRAPVLVVGSVLLGVVLTLSGCGAPADPVAEPTATVDEPVVDEPTPEPSAELPAFGPEILTVTGRATATNGAVLTLSMTAYEPVESGSPDGQAILAYLAEQGDTSALTTGTVVADEQPLLMPFTISSVAEGSAVWPESEGPVTFLGSGDVDAIVGVPTRLPGTVIIGAGTGFAVSTITNIPGRPLTVEDWPNRFAYFGFETLDTGETLSDCTVTLTPYAEQFDVVAEQWRVIRCVVGVAD